MISRPHVLPLAQASVLDPGARYRLPGWGICCLEQARFQGCNQMVHRQGPGSCPSRQLEPRLRTKQALYAKVRRSRNDDNETVRHGGTEAKGGSLLLVERGELLARGARWRSQQPCPSRDSEKRGSGQQQQQRHQQPPPAGPLFLPFILGW